MRCYVLLCVLLTGMPGGMGNPVTFWATRRVRDVCPVVSIGKFGSPLAENRTLQIRLTPMRFFVGQISIGTVFSYHWTQ